MSRYPRNVWIDQHACLPHDESHKNIIATEIRKQIDPVNSLPMVLMHSTFCPPSSPNSGEQHFSYSPTPHIRSFSVVQGSASEALINASQLFLTNLVAQEAEIDTVMLRCTQDSAGRSHHACIWLQVLFSLRIGCECLANFEAIISVSVWRQLAHIHPR